MTIRAHLDSAFAEQFGLPQIEPPVLRQRNAMDDLIEKMVRSLPLAGTLNTIYRVSCKDGEVKAECIPESEWRLPDVDPPIAPGLAVTEYRMDGLLLGNADIAINNRESVEGLFIEDATMNTENKAPVVVPNSTSSHDANRLYGEAYGVDWVYETAVGEG